MLLLLLLCLVPISSASADYTEDIGEIYISTSITNPAGENYVAGIKRIYKGWVHKGPTFDFVFSGYSPMGPIGGSGNGQVHPYDFEFEGPTQYSPYVTMLYSVNNRLENARWQPGKEYVEAVENYVSRLAGIGVVYSGWWDIGGDTYPVDKSNGATRAKELLGYDITLIEEQFSYNHTYHNWQLGDDTDTYYYSGDYLGSFNYKPIDATNVTREWAVMALYKAMRQDIVNYYLAIRKDPSIHIETTPLAEIITVPVHELQLDKAWTDVFMTRSYAPAYWDRAVNEHLVFGYEGAEGEEYKQHRMTWGEFCELAMNFMVMYGEPTLTEEESLYILEVFGRVLPHYLQSNQLDAVKYLMARGIVDSDHNFTDEIPLDACLDIIMKIFDEGSRETFKNLTLVYDPKLLSDGFYPSEMSSFSHDIEFFTETDYSTATAYDYFVLVTDNTRFVEAMYGSDVTSGIYVSAVPGDTSTAPMKGSSYMGIIHGPDGQEYYHFRVPVTLPAGTYVKDGKSAWITINTQNESDKPHNIRLKYGGGWYGVETIRNGITYVSQSKNFAVDDDERYVDAARKLAAQDIVDEVPLFDTSKGQYKVSIRIPEDQTDHVSFKIEGANNGDPVPFDKVIDPAGEYKILEKDPLDEDLYILHVDNLAEAKSMVVVDGGADARIFQTFSKDGNVHLVNLDYMKEIGAIIQYDWYSNGRLLFIQSVDTNVFIDVNSNIIYAGTTVTEVDDAARLWYEDSVGNIYVDYRAIVGWSSKYTTCTSKDGVVSVNWKDSFQKNTDAQSVGVLPAYVRSNDIRDFTLHKVLVDTSDGNTDIILSSSYPLANYFVYQAVNKSNTNKQDWIFVFKLRDTFKERVGEEVDVEARALLEQFLGVTVPDRWCVFAEQLERSVTRVDTKNRYYYSAENQSYQYIPEPLSSCSDYSLKPTGQDSGLATLLPLYVDVDRENNDFNIYDINMNIQIVDAETQPYGYVPDKMLGNNTDTWYNCLGPAGDKVVVEPTVEITDKSNIATIPAPTAVVAGLLELGEIKMSTAAYSWYYGTLPVKWAPINIIRGMFCTDKPSNDVEIWDDGPETIGAIGLVGIDMETPFRLAYRHLNSSVYVANDAGLTYTENLVEPEKSSPIKSFGAALAGFDWETFKSQGLLTNLDDLLTILTIFVLNILPRLFMFIFMVLMTLACVARVRPVIVFCEKIWDPYSFLTLGRQNVHTISLTHLFISSMIALALYGLFQNGLILELMGWIGRAVTGILDR